MKLLRGFSLLEAMVVVAIIGIVTGIAVPNYQIHIKKTAMAEVLGLLDGFKSELASAVSATGGFPNTLASFISGVAASDFTVVHGGTKNTLNIYYGCAGGSCNSSKTEAIIQIWVTGTLSACTQGVALKAIINGSTLQFSCGLCKNQVSSTCFSYLPAICQNTLDW
jgi:type IV pilus assembly protein PilA